MSRFFMALFGAAAFVPSAFGAVKKTFACDIVEKKYVVELSYEGNDLEAPSKMKIYRNIKGSLVLLLAGSPTTSLEYQWTEAGVKEGTSPSHDISLSDPSDPRNGYTMFLNAYFKGGDGFAAIQRMYGGKPTDNCKPL